MLRGCMENIKAKTPFKSVIPSGSELRERTLSTLDVISQVVGGTLGPCGRPVLIERQEYALPPTVTKDGVTVFRAFGFRNSSSHCLMEAARDAAVRTASTAGDGTTTATILAEAFVRLTWDYCDRNPHQPPQAVVRRLHDLYSKVLLPEIKALSVIATLDGQDEKTGQDNEGTKLLRNVARISANGDKDLADAVMKCYEICGDDGNVTIVEASGPTAYEVEKIDGYPIPIGFEESCGKFFPVFINRPETQQVIIEKPAFLLHFGRINDIQTLLPLMNRLQEAWEGEYLSTPNVVVVATGFSESVLASLAHNWAGTGSINIFPLVLPMSPQHNGQRHDLDDLAAVTAATVFDLLTKPLDSAEFDDLGNLAKDNDDKWKPLGIRAVECSRYRTTVLGFCQEDFLLQRVEQVRGMVQHSGSELDETWSKERLAKLTGGIAKLKVVGNSNGELKERRDRVEDAVCAVRGALKDGCLIGGGWTLARLASILPKEDAVAQEIMAAALLEPVRRLYVNAGASEVVKTYRKWWCPWKKVVIADEVTNMVVTLLAHAASGLGRTYDAFEARWVDAHEAGILDSTPAVRDAIKNSLSIATLLGTLGGMITFPRNDAFELADARDAADYERAAATNPADERAM
jgi:chaperonin GroEL